MKIVRVMVVVQVVVTGKVESMVLMVLKVLMVVQMLETKILGPACSLIALVSIHGLVMQTAQFAVYSITMHLGVRMVLSVRSGMIVHIVKRKVSEFSTLLCTVISLRVRAMMVSHRSDYLVFARVTVHFLESCPLLVTTIQLYLTFLLRQLVTCSKPLHLLPILCTKTVRCHLV